MTDFLTWWLDHWPRISIFSGFFLIGFAIGRLLQENPYFIQWWAAHWPLAVVAIPLLVAYPIIFYELQHAWAKWTDGV